MPLAAAIGVGGSLLSGIFGRNSAKKAQAAQNEYNKPINIRKRAEEGGFNPLLFVGPGVGQQAAPAPSGHMGQAISQASAMLADHLAKSPEDKLRQQNLELQNKRLEKEIAQLTLNPKVPGIYQTRHFGPKAAPIAEEPEQPVDWSKAPPVMLWNPTANKMVPVAAGYAHRLDLKEGDTIMAEDYEAMVGDVASEAINLPNAANEMIGVGTGFESRSGHAVRHGLTLRPRRKPGSTPQRVLRMGPGKNYRGNRTQYGW